MLFTASPLSSRLQNTLLVYEILKDNVPWFVSKILHVFPEYNYMYLFIAIFLKKSSPMIYTVYGILRTLLMEARFCCFKSSLHL